MPRSANQKLKLLALAEIFQRETDDQHPLTLQEIADRLAARDISVERKTLYSDFEALTQFGLDINSEQRGRQTYYWLGQRDFELPELKLLVDAVQSSRFMTDKKSRALIGKLEHLASVHQARRLHRQVLIAGRVKTMNESIWYNVDSLHEAIEADEAVRFKYFQWNVDREMELRHGGAWYEVSPWLLMYVDENYYLVGYDAADDRIKHYRVDKMLRITATGQKRSGKQRFREFDAARYARSLFGMYGGERVQVTLECENRMIGILIDRFGSDLWTTPLDRERFLARVEVAVSPQFLGWIAALGDGVRLTAPESAVSQMRETAARLRDMYLPCNSGSDTL